jgi:hypothetical protein
LKGGRKIAIDVENDFNDWGVLQMEGCLRGHGALVTVTAGVPSRHVRACVQPCARSGGLLQETLFEAGLTK